jgi:RNA polymerase sigma-70 factor (ECF subfamily)
MTADGRLVECVLEGDSEAFGELVRRYERRAFAIAYRLLGHRHDAEDLVQDSFMVALDQLEKFDLARPFAPWFFRILVNLGHNARDARRVRSTEEIPHEVASRDVAGLESLERTEIGERVRSAIADLSDRQRLVVQLHELEEFSTREVADMLEIAEPTVRWTLHSARKRLREALAGWRKEELQ